MFNITINIINNSICFTYLIYKLLKNKYEKIIAIKTYKNICHFYN